MSRMHYLIVSFLLASCFASASPVARDRHVRHSVNFDLVPPPPPPPLVSRLVKRDPWGEKNVWYDAPEYTEKLKAFVKLDPEAYGQELRKPTNLLGEVTRARQAKAVEDALKKGIKLEAETQERKDWREMTEEERVNKDKNPGETDEQFKVRQAELQEETKEMLENQGYSEELDGLRARGGGVTAEDVKAYQTIFQKNVDIFEDGVQNGVKTTLNNVLSVQNSIVGEDAGAAIVDEISILSRFMWVGEFIGPVLFAACVLLFVYDVWQLSKAEENRVEAERRSRALEMARPLSAETLAQEQCFALNDAAERAEQGPKDDLGMDDYKEMLDSFAPIWYRAYENATNTQIDLIAATKVENWGPPLDPLPPIPRDGRTDRRIREQYMVAHNAWYRNELLRPIHLQYQLTRDYSISVHNNAFLHLVKSTELPFPAESDMFRNAYMIFYLRMQLPISQCSSLIREDHRASKQFEIPRQEQALRDLALQLKAQTYFAARSRLPPTLPAPAIVV